MFDRFTDRARKVLSIAMESAMRMYHESIGTEHILLALVEEGTGVAAIVLKNLGVGLKEVRANVEQSLKDNLRNLKRERLPLSPGAKRVLELSVEEANKLGHNYVGTEHLLLGLIREEKGVAARVLLELGANLEAVRDEILMFIGVSPRGSTLDVKEGRTLVARTFEYDPIPDFRPHPSMLRIGVIGAGGIVQNAHLPGYAKWYLKVAAIFDVNADAAKAAAEKFKIATVCRSVDELLAHKDVDVLDVAIPEHGRPAVLPAILKAGKPTLLQKPLAYTLEEAKRIVGDFERAKVPLAVNQNMRWSPEFRAAKHLLSSGVIGRVFDLRWTMRNTCDRRGWAKGSWYSRDPRFQVLSWSIHQLDAFRFLLDDEPGRVYCTLPRRPDQNFVGDVAANVLITFRDGAQASMIDSNVATPGRPEVQECDVDADLGSIYLKVSAPRDFRYWLLRECPKDGNGEGDAPTHSPKLEGEWYPDGFAGAMGDFLEAIEKGREPSVSGRKNLGTMALVDACYRSAASGQAVDVEKT